MDIKNGVAIISGGACGMGAATARMLSSAGAKVTILDIDLNAAKSVAEEINGLAIQCDITDADSVENALKQAANLYGFANICINCAGIIKSRRLINQDGPMPLKDFKEVINVNLTGTFNLMRLAAANMQTLPLTHGSQERGVIINTASIAAFEGQIGQIAYSASKGGIVSMTLPAARELARFGIRVVTVAPGLVDTGMLQKIPTATCDALIANVPFPHRLAKPEEFAKLVLHIIDNEMINGEVIRLDGALRLPVQ